MADEPIQLRGAVVLFIVDGGDPETIDNFDALVTLADGSRWSATLLTVTAIQRVMDRWAATKQYQNGDFFQSDDLVIVRRPGVPFATDLVQRLVDADELRYTFVRVRDEDED